VTRQPGWVQWAFRATAILLPIGWLIAVIVWVAFLKVRR
jgi:hypothetical protein